MKKRLTTVLLIIFTAFSTTLNIFAATLIPSGESIGIVLNYQGVYITGTYDYVIDNQHFNPINDDFLSGDLITEINGKSIQSIEELAKVIQESLDSNQMISTTVLRNEDKLNRNLRVNYDNQTQTFKTGLYVKDTTAGVGTMTYYDPEHNTFGSLGHSLNDTTLNLEFPKGSIFTSTVTGIVKNSKKKTGEKIAIIEKDQKIGEVKQNTDIGVFGYYDQLDISKTMESATIDEVKIGPAYIMTVLENKEIQKIDIEIIDLKKQDKSEPKGISFKVTDQEFLKLTNGVIQGMSGSPIVQNDKIIGAISHVSAKDHTLGYGVYIEWMLEKSNNLE